MQIRFAIWAAVSSKPQAAADKFSLPTQLDRSREVGLGKGWRETAGPYIVSGQSREHYIQLFQAEEELPAMREMLAAAREHKFDVLVMAEFDRLRGLMMQVLRTLAQYQIQLYALSMPIEPVPPAEYNIYRADNVLALITMAQMSSSFEISRMRRKYIDNMPKRITERGLPKGQIPFGFQKPTGRETDRSAIPIADPVRSAVVVKIKDLYLQGKSHWQIADQLNAESIPAPKGGRWSDVKIRLILKNKFYSGSVIFGRTRRITDPITGLVKVVGNSPDKIVFGKGAHTPLWDADTERRIEAEFARRGRKYTGAQTNRLSNLLYCGTCGARCWVSYPGGYNEERRRWRCCKHGSAHLSIKDAELVPLVITAIQKAASTARELKRALPKDARGQITSRIAALHARRNRLTDALEEGHLDSATYEQRIKPIDSQMAESVIELQRAQNEIDNYDAKIEGIKKLAEIINTVPEYILEGPAQEVNAQLGQWIERVIIFPDKKIKIKFR